jgi:DNA-binding NarL/FixJ family response regulator
MLSNKIESGCEFWKDCFSCPYPDCLLDVKLPNIRMAMRRAAVLELLRAGYTQQQVAEKLKISQATVSRYASET